MISVIIPAYNAEKYISKCLDSLLNQTYKEFEVIVINDGSLDHTKEKVESYIHKFKKCSLITQKNSGVSVARNVGIKRAEGNYLFFLDSDDFLDKNALHELIADEKRYGSDLACCEIVDKYSSEIAKDTFCSNISFQCNTREDIGRNLFFIRTGSCCGKLYKKSIIEKYGIRFPTGFNLAEDLIFVHEYCIHILSLSKNIKSKYYVENSNEQSLSKKYVANIEEVMNEQNMALESAFSVFPKYEDEFYKHSIDINTKSCFYIVKNLTLNGCLLSWKEKIDFLKESRFINKVLNNLPIKDKSLLPKLRNDRIQYMVFCTKNIYFILCFYTIFGVARKIKHKLIRAK